MEFNSLKEFMDFWGKTLIGASWLEDDAGNITHLTWEWGNLLFSITAPHIGNDYTYMLRVNPKKTFDKWGNADIEEFYDDLTDLAEDLDHSNWIYITLMDIYIDRYIESLGE